MSGSYQMQVVDGGEFSVPIPQFVLSVPRVLH
jgi:ApaG protein